MSNRAHVVSGRDKSSRETSAEQNRQDVSKQIEINCAADSMCSIAHSTPLNQCRSPKRHFGDTRSVLLVPIFRTLVVIFQSSLEQSLQVAGLKRKMKSLIKYTAPKSFPFFFLRRNMRILLWPSHFRKNGKQSWLLPHSVRARVPHSFPQIY